MSEKIVVMNYDELKDGDPVIFFGVHMLRWRQDWGEPTVAFTTIEDDRDEQIAALRSALGEIADFQDDKDDEWLTENHGETAMFMRRIARNALKGAK